MNRSRQGNKVGWVLVGLLIPISLLFFPTTTVIEPDAEPEIKIQINERALVRGYLDSKSSPLAEHTDYLLTKPTWKLLIAVSSIESQFCKRQVDFNCWGIGGDSAYRHYKNHEEAIDDADRVIQYWQAKGRWLTVEDMNCHYVQPCSPNWVKVVNKTLQEIKNLIEPKL